VFEKFSQAIQQKYPQIKVEGGNYPPPPVNQAIAQFLTIAKVVLILLIISNQNPFPYLGIQTPSVYTWLVENKLYGCMMLFFISNAIEGQLVTTGAFEITYNDMPVWSKLETGRIPSAQEMFQILDNQFNLS
jgi:selT/selW/selH-like putative selenoprotein